MPSVEQQSESSPDTQQQESELTTPSKVRVVNKRRVGLEENTLDLADLPTTPTPAPADATPATSSALPKINVTDEPELDPVDVLINKVFNYVMEQPEFFAVLRLSRPERKRLERGIARLMTRFPTIGKA